MITNFLVNIQIFPYLLFFNKYKIIPLSKDVKRKSSNFLSSEVFTAQIVYGTPHFYYSKGDTDKDGSYSPTELGGNKVLGDKIEWYIDDVVYNTMYLDTLQYFEQQLKL